MPGGGKGGGASSTVNVNNGPVTVDADSTVEVVGLDNIKVTATLQPSPLRTESRQELVLPQPLRTESRLDTKSDISTDSKISSDSKNALSVDLKPVALDVCLNTSTSLPHGQICQPFNVHLGFTWFGVELFGINYGGETRTVLQDLPKKPAVEWPAQQNAAAPHPGPVRVDGGTSGRGDGGLRVRIK